MKYRDPYEELMVALRGREAPMCLVPAAVVKEVEGRFFWHSRFAEIQRIVTGLFLVSPLPILFYWLAAATDLLKSAPAYFSMSVFLLVVGIVFYGLGFMVEKVPGKSCEDLTAIPKHPEWRNFGEFFDQFQALMEALGPKASEMGSWGMYKVKNHAQYILRQQALVIMGKEDAEPRNRFAASAEREEFRRLHKLFDLFGLEMGPYELYFER